MTADEVTVRARTADGQLEPRTRTLYSTRYGPMFTSLLGLPLFPWTPAKAFALGDANAGNFRYLNHFLETDMAQSTREYDAVLRRNQGIPWVNSIGADAGGEAYYADISVVPHVTDEQAQTCNTALGQGTFQALRLPISTARARPAIGDRTPTPSSPARSGRPGTCRRCSGPTT